MLDISSAKVKKLIVHRVGNRLRDEGYLLSQKEAERTPTLDDLLLKNYLAAVVEHGELYEFHHESDIALNTVHHFTELIFKDQKTFKTYAQNIAKHLYSASTHPNIGGGEFIVILFDDVRIEGESEQALGLFRIEGKSDYLDVEDEKGNLRIIERIGISVDKIQKGAIAVSGGKKVYIIDSLGQKTKYWVDTFLKVVPSATSKACAKAAGAFLKAVSNKVSSPNESLEFSRRLQKSLSDSDDVSFSEIREISTLYLDEDEVNGILTGIRGRTGIEIEDEMAINAKQLSRHTREMVTRARIAEGINILISKNGALISSLDVKKIKSGIRAIIEIQLKGA